MRHIVDPRQTTMFDPYEQVFSPLAFKRITTGWQGVFRHVILEVMPVDTIAGEFSENDGRPTKELYSMAGLVFIKEFHGWSSEQAAEEYMLNLGIQYALNLGPGGQSLSYRTVERYMAIFREHDLGAKVFHDVTAALVTALDKDVSRQRLDSTHVYSNMAVFGRTKLMGVAVKRFLTQVHRHDRAAFDTLPEDVRKRYAPAANRLFGDTMKDSRPRKPIRQQVAEDMLMLIQRFECTGHAERTTYKDMVRVFDEQCTVEQDRVTLADTPGKSVMQNTSDPDATYDGRKKRGYKVQVAETCTKGDVQLLTEVLPQTAAESDMNSLAPVVAELKDADLAPDTMLSDKGYGSDANVEQCKGDGIELISPVNKSRRNDANLHVEDFDIDPDTERVRRCPAGHAPIESIHDPEKMKTRTVFDGTVCKTCPNSERCPANGKKNHRSFYHTPQERRCGQRYKHEKTDEFRTDYAKRAGIEGTISRLKSCVGIRRLPVRGKESVYEAIYLRLAGWNILQSAKSRKMREIIARIIRELCPDFVNTWLVQPFFRLLYHMRGLFHPFASPVVYSGSAL